MNGMTIIVKTITRLLIGFIIVFSASIILYGHITPYTFATTLLLILSPPGFLTERHKYVRH